MIRQRDVIVMFTATATVLSFLLMLAPPAAMSRQVGVKAPPSRPKTVEASESAPRITKVPARKTPAPKTTKSTIDERFIATYPVLSRIGTYKAPPYPKNAYTDRETYDYRIHYKAPVPATLPDVLVCDIWQRITQDLKLNVSPKDVSEATISEAMNIYLKRDWRPIAGYRPWTHWNFIRGLDAAEREALAKEITEYIEKNGVRDVKK
ncbi:MAG TPA: hypothetical protein VJ464_17765 [Blastocatellia bacterium]|nr:hypothetical protein [Blastocatellia bacterium]